MTPTCTSASSRSSSSGRTQRELDRRRPAFVVSLSRTRVPQTWSITWSKNAGSFPDDTRPRDQDDGDRGRGQDHERVLGRRLPRLLGDPATRPHVTGTDVPGQQHPVHLLSGDRRTVVNSTGTTVRRRNAGRTRNTSGKSIFTGAVRARWGRPRGVEPPHVGRRGRPISSASDDPRVSVRVSAPSRAAGGPGGQAIADARSSSRQRPPRSTRIEHRAGARRRAGPGAPRPRGGTRAGARDPADERDREQVEEQPGSRDRRPHDGRRAVHGVAPPGGPPPGERGGGGADRPSRTRGIGATGEEHDRCGRAADDPALGHAAETTP